MPKKAKNAPTDPRESAGAVPVCYLVFRSEKILVKEAHLPRCGAEVSAYDRHYQTSVHL